MTVGVSHKAQSECVRIERLHDRALIAETLAHHRVYPWISDDASPGPEYVGDAISDSALYLGAFSDEYLGLFMVHAHNGALYEVHTCLLPAAWGSRAARAAQALIAWVFDNTPCQRLITNVPDDNPLALRFAERAGLVLYGTNPRSILRGGVLRDQAMLGINKEDITCPH